MCQSWLTVSSASTVKFLGDGKICVSCGSDKTSKAGWYAGPTCSACYSRAYNEKNRVNLRDKALDGYLKDLPEARRRSRERYHRNKYDPEFKFKRLKIHGPRKNKEVTVTLSEYLSLVSQGCSYCGADLTFNKGSGLDRIDNSKGYTLDNVLSCCGDCNKLRGNRLTVEETKIAVRAVLNYREQLDETKQRATTTGQTCGRSSPI